MSLGIENNAITYARHIELKNVWNAAQTASQLTGNAIKGFYNFATGGALRLMLTTVTAPIWAVLAETIVSTLIFGMPTTHVLNTLLSAGSYIIGGVGEAITHAVWDGITNGFNTLVGYIPDIPSPSYALEGLMANNVPLFKTPYLGGGGNGSFLPMQISIGDIPRFRF